MESKTTPKLTLSASKWKMTLLEYAVRRMALLYPNFSDEDLEELENLMEPKSERDFAEQLIDYANDCEDDRMGVLSDYFQSMVGKEE